MRVLREIFVSVAPMDRSPRWHKPAGRLDQPARPRRVLAVIRVLVLLAAPGGPCLQTPPPPGGGQGLYKDPRGEAGGVNWGLLVPPDSPRRPARSDDGADRPADGSAASQP